MNHAGISLRGTPPRHNGTQRLPTSESKTQGLKAFATLASRGSPRTKKRAAHRSVQPAHIIPSF